MPRIIEPDKLKCPNCRTEQDDFDGFGFIFCPKCGYCIHPSSTLVNGKWICGICGREVKPY
jgi:ribosomal protein L37AE/L43A